jgi:hypothetical protein
VKPWVQTPLPQKKKKKDKRITYPSWHYDLVNQPILEGTIDFYKRRNIHIAWESLSWDFSTLLQNPKKYRIQFLTCKHCVTK